MRLRPVAIPQSLSAASLAAKAPPRSDMPSERASPVLDTSPENSRVTFLATSIDALRLISGYSQSPKRAIQAFQTSRVTSDTGPRCRRAVWAVSGQPQLNRRCGEMPCEQTATQAQLHKRHFAAKHAATQVKLPRLPPDGPCCAANTPPLCWASAGGQGLALSCTCGFSLKCAGGFPLTQPVQTPSTGNLHSPTHPSGSPDRPCRHSERSGTSRPSSNHTHPPWTPGRDHHTVLPAQAGIQGTGAAITTQPRPTPTPSYRRRPVSIGRARLSPNRLSLAPLFYPRQCNPERSRGT